MLTQKQFRIIWLVLVEESVNADSKGGTLLYPKNSQNKSRDRIYAHSVEKMVRLQMNIRPRLINEM